MIPDIAITRHDAPGRRDLQQFGKMGVVVAASALAMVFTTAGPAEAATGPDSLSGSASGASIGGAVRVLPPTPAVTLPASGAATSKTIIVSHGPVLTHALLSASTGSTNDTLAAEQVNSEGLAGNGNVSIPGSATVLAVRAVDSTCISNASGSTGTDHIAGLTIGGIPVPVPITPNAVLTGLGPLAPLISIEANMQAIKNAIGSTSITNDALVITILGAANPGETITLGQSMCAAKGPDVIAASTSAGTTPNSGAVAGVTTIPTGEPWAGAIPPATIVFLLGSALFWRRRLASIVDRVTPHAVMVILHRGQSSG
ncbi:MAG: choice-of-anchor P family protein [Acidimicrobiales bacterium]